VKVLLRCDASSAIGSGHVMRCLTLADHLSRGDAEIVFVCRRQPGDLIPQLTRKGYEVHVLEGGGDREEDARETAAFARRFGGFDWLVVDHYQLDLRFEQALRPFCRRLLVIDDLADRPHACDLLLDQNLYPDMGERYRGLVPVACRLLLGPHYALLRSEFLLARLRLRPRCGEFTRLLISFGGSDPTGETAKALEAVRLAADERLFIDVVAGGANPGADSLRAACAGVPRCTFHHRTDAMAELMSSADLSLGGGGGTTWERCFLGLPSLTIVAAANQRAVTEAVAAFGATWNLGWHENVTPQLIADRLVQLRNAPYLLAEASARCFELMGEGDGTAGHPLVSLMSGGEL